MRIIHIKSSYSIPYNKCAHIQTKTSNKYVFYSSLNEKTLYSSYNASVMQQLRATTTV